MSKTNSPPKTTRQIKTSRFIFIREYTKIQTLYNMEK